MLDRGWWAGIVNATAVTLRECSPHSLSARPAVRSSSHDALGAGANSQASRPLRNESDAARCQRGSEPQVEIVGARLGCEFWGSPQCAVVTLFAHRGSLSEKDSDIIRVRQKLLILNRGFFQLLSQFTNLITQGCHFFAQFVESFIKIRTLDPNFAGLIGHGTDGRSQFRAGLFDLFI